MKVITINNCKGGVAKSTSTQAIASILEHDGHKTLVIDCDQQRNTTDVYISEKVKFNLYDVYSERCSLEEAIIHTDKGDIIASDRHLELADAWINDKPDGIFFLKHQLERIANLYEFVIIDTNMNQNKVLDSTLVACDMLIIPTDDDVSTTRSGVSQLINHVRYLEDNYSIKINIGGIVLIKYSTVTTSWKKTVEYFDECCKTDFHTKVYNTRIPVGVAVKDAHREYNTVALGAPKSKVALAYRELVKEIMGDLEND